MSPIPAAWVDRLFKRFAGMYGSQKIGSMWLDADMAEVKAVWGEALGQFHGDSIGGAIGRLVASGSQWPPTLPEFVELCRQSALGRTNAMPALPAPRGNPEVASREIAAAAETIGRSRPSRDWAHRILARHEAGEHLYPAVLRIARNAVAEPRA